MNVFIARERSLIKGHTTSKREIVIDPLQYIE